jgi:hypothetical protein
MQVYLEYSPLPKKKFRVIFPDGYKVDFGAIGYPDFTTKNGTDIKKKDMYLKRHFKREDWNNIYTAGFWATNLLWNKGTINESIRDIEKRFKIDII